MEEEKMTVSPSQMKDENQPVQSKETQYGSVEIADSVILDLVNVALGKVEEIVKDQKKEKKAVAMDRKGNENTVSITVSTKLMLSKSIREVAEKIQRTIKEEVEGITGLIKVEKVTINVLDVALMLKEEPQIPTFSDDEPGEHPEKKG